MKKYSVVYPETGVLIGKYEAADDNAAIAVFEKLYPAYERIKSQGDDIAAYIREYTGAIVVIRRQEVS